MTTEPPDSPTPADLAALRKRHYAVEDQQHDRIYRRCLVCHVAWPCDAAVLGTALDAARAEKEAALDARTTVLLRPIDTYACSACGRADGLDAAATPELWDKLSDGQPHIVLCLSCTAP